VVPPAAAIISGPKYFGKAAAESAAAATGKEPPPAVEAARAEKAKVEAAMQALRAVDMASGPAFLELQDRLVAMDIVLGEHAAARKASVPLEIRLARAAKERDETSKKLARTKELLSSAAEDLRKALQAVNELQDRGQAQEAKLAKLTAELRELGQQMSEEAGPSSSDDEDDDADAPDDPMASPRGSESNQPEEVAPPLGAAPASSGSAGHTACGCWRGRNWADMSSAATEGGQGTLSLESLVEQGAEALKRQVDGHNGPEEPKRPKAGKSVSEA
jgi:hypothetical protein